MKPQINVDGVLRDMTDEEIAQYELDLIENAKLKETEITKAAARQAVLDRLGLTEEEAQLILGGSN